MRLSVIIPVYNVEHYVRRCLDSVFAAADRLSPRHEVEVICVDDGSTDGSLAVLRAYERPLTVLTQANAGQGAARNAALAVATGESVVYVDSDDYIIPCALERLVTAAEESGAPVVSSMVFARDVAPEPEPTPHWRLRPAAWMAGKKVQYSVCGKLFRREVLEGLVFPACVYEDFAFATEVFGSIDHFAAIEAPLYVYCTNPGESTTIRSGLTAAKVAASFTVLRHVVAFFQARGMSRFVRRQLKDGLSSTIGQVYKARSAELTCVLLDALGAFRAECPEVRLTLKAWYRLWCLLRRLPRQFRKEAS